MQLTSQGQTATQAWVGLSTSNFRLACLRIPPLHVSTAKECEETRLRGEGTTWTQAKMWAQMILFFIRVSPNSGSVFTHRTRTETSLESTACISWNFWHNTLVLGPTYFITSHLETIWLAFQNLKFCIINFSLIFSALTVTLQELIITYWDKNVRCSASLKIKEYR